MKFAPLRVTCLLTVFLLVIGLMTTVSKAQSADVPIEPDRLQISDQTIITKLSVLRSAGKLVSIEAIQKKLINPSPTAITLPPPATEHLQPAEIARRGHKALLRVGWYYLCAKCGNWHLNTADGYAITKDGAACTCYHVFMPDQSVMREAYAFAMNADGDVYPITAILAADRRLDAAIFQLSGKDFSPLPLNDQNAPGDPVYLVSDPSGVAGYFTAGMIDRYHWEGRARHAELNSLAVVRNLRIDVSTDWAPGSSGAAVLDACGNAIGHVATISAEMAEPSPEPGILAAPTTGPSNPDLHMNARSSPRATYIVMHQAVPARGVRLLAETMNSTEEKKEKTP